ncbi:MAG: hypothetical protein ABJ004_09765 [Cyclobacteriaceae bacterium]
MKHLLLSILILAGSSIVAQVPDSVTMYDVSDKNPFGLLNPTAPPQTADFAELIGTCHCKSVTRNPDKTWADTTTMTWTWKYIMNGTAVQDEVWRPDGRYAGSIRQYHTDSASWVVSYYSYPGASWSLGTWHGNREGNQILLYKPQQAPNGMDGFHKITFSEIRNDGFNWKGEWVDPTESFSYPTWMIFCTRQN